MFLCRKDKANVQHSIFINQIHDVARKSIPQGGRMLLFGSQARGDAREDSDWEKRKFTPFYKNVEQDGIELWH